MAKKRRKRKNTNLSFLLGLFLTIIAFIVYFIISLQSKISMSIIQTKTLDLGEVKRTINKDMVIVRENVPINSKSSGLATMFYQQGDRIPKNAVVMKVQDSQSKENEIIKLSRLNAQIEDMQNSVQSLSPEVEKQQIQSNINYLYLDIQERIKNSDYKYVSKLKTELDRLINKKKAYDGSSNDTNNIYQLQEKKRQLENRLLTSNVYLKSPISGEVNYYKDGLEKKFSVENMKKLTVNDLTTVKNQITKIDKKEVKSGDLLCYMVDNHKYYMLTEIKKEDVEAIKRGVKLNIILPDANINAYFDDFYKDKDGKFVGIFLVESEDFDFLKNRKVNCDIVYARAKGIVIPNEAIINKNGKQGVYVVDKVGTAHFVNITNVLLSDDDNTVIQFSYDDLSDPSKIKLYDDVILSPKNISDGQKVR